MRSGKLDPPQTEYFEGSSQVYRMNSEVVGQFPITPASNRAPRSAKVDAAGKSGIIFLFGFCLRRLSQRLQDHPILHCYCTVFSRNSRNRRNALYGMFPPC